MYHVFLMFNPLYERMPLSFIFKYPFIKFGKAGAADTK